MNLSKPQRITRQKAFRFITKSLTLVSIVFLTYAFLGVMLLGCVPTTSWTDLPVQDQQKFMRCEQDLFRASCYEKGEKFANPACVQRYIQEYTRLDSTIRASWLKQNGCAPYLADAE